MHRAKGTHMGNTFEIKVPLLILGKHVKWDLEASNYYDF